MATIYLSDRISSPTPQEKDLLNNGISAGTIVVEPIFTDNANGTFDIGQSDVLLFDNPSHEGELKRYTIPAQTALVAPVGVTSYLIANYNAGTPVYQVTQDVELINESDIIPVTTIFNENNLVLHTIDWNLLGQGLSNKLHKRVVKTERFKRESGLMVSETQTPANRTVLVSLGRIWIGAHEVDLPSFNSSVDRWYFWYNSTGTWTFDLNTTQYNNTQYDNGTDLVAAGPNTYLVNWIYRDLDQNSHAAYVLGENDYGSLAAAVAAQPRNDLPEEIISHGILVGKIIVVKNATTASQIDSAFDVEFQSTQVTDHNSLGNLQGGLASEYYHLRSSDYQAYTQLNGRAETDVFKIHSDFEMSFDATIHLNDATNTDYLMWDDYVTDLTNINNNSPDSPTWSAFRNGIYGWSFSATALREVFVNVHIRHDIALNTVLYPHVHWAPTTASTGVVRWGFEYTVARGHQQEAFPVTTTIYAEQSAVGTAYYHHITEVIQADAVPSTNIEPDSVVMFRIFRDAANVNDTFPDPVFAFMFDLHYQRSRFGTVGKEPPFYTV